MLAVLKVIGLVLAIIIPGGFLLMGLFIWLGPKILRFMSKRIEKELNK